MILNLKMCSDGFSFRDGCVMTDVHPRVCCLNVTCKKKTFFTFTLLVNITLIL